MPILHACVELDDVTGRPCGALSRGYRCPEHEAAHERARVREAPWRRLYRDPRWTTASVKQRRADGERCTFEVDGRRCNATELLTVHHEIKIKDLWKRAGGEYSRFVKLATDHRHLRTLCGPHHKFVEFGQPPPAIIRPPVHPKPRRRRRERRRHELIEPIESLLPW